MKMNYPFSDYGRVLKLTSTIVETGEGMAVDEAASSLGLSPQAATFKYQVLAARLIGFLSRRENRLNATHLGRRFAGPGPQPGDIEAVLSRVPAFSDLPAAETDAISDAGIAAFLLAAGVPLNRVSKTRRFYRDLVSGHPGKSENSLIRLSPNGTLPVPEPSGLTPQAVPDVGLEPLPTTSTHVAPTVNSTDEAWLMSDEALKALFAKAPKAGSSWSDARRENFISCIDALLRELLWVDD